MTESVNTVADDGDGPLAGNAAAPPAQPDATAFDILNIKLAT
jgi:hypothetical protein